jgi:hypothetical protein
LLERPFGGLGISKLKVLIKKRKQKNQWYFFYQFLVIETLDPDYLEMVDPDLDPQICAWLRACFVRQGGGGEPAANFFFMYYSYNSPAGI